MGTTDNGYSAPPAEGLRACGVDGAFLVPGIKNWDPVWICFQYLVQQFDERVEWLRPGWCWGYAYRENRNDPYSLSRHSGAIAGDLNAPLHPNGVPTKATFTPGQIATINTILDEVKCPCHNERVFRWGGDYTGTPDAMHFEINREPACVENAANFLLEGEDMLPEDFKQIRTIMREVLQPFKADSRRRDRMMIDMLREAAEADKNQARMLRALVKDMRAENRAELEQQAQALETRANSRLNTLASMEVHPAEDEDH